MDQSCILLENKEVKTTPDRRTLGSQREYMSIENAAKLEELFFAIMVMKRSEVAWLKCANKKKKSLLL